ncbi:hypothetical protein QQ045_031216 [Rhodiola kirilowii]
MTNSHCLELLSGTKKRETCIESGYNNSELVTPQDVASYARWCALASFDWTEWKNKVINNSNFKKFLEPVFEVRELITNFYSSHYTLCLVYPGDSKSNLLLDINQSDHVKTLYEQVHEEAVIQCVYHFMFVDMRMQANACRTTISELKKETEAFITDNQSQARIDSHNQKICYFSKVLERYSCTVLLTGTKAERTPRSKGTKNLRISGYDKPRTMKLKMRVRSFSSPRRSLSILLSAALSSLPTTAESPSHVVRRPYTEITKITDPSIVGVDPKTVTLDAGDTVDDYGGEDD